MTVAVTTLKSKTPPGLVLQVKIYSTDNGPFIRITLTNRSSRPLAVCPRYPYVQIMLQKANGQVCLNWLSDAKWPGLKDAEIKFVPAFKNLKWEMRLATDAISKLAGGLLFVEGGGLRAAPEADARGSKSSGTQFDWITNKVKLQKSP